VPIPAAAPATDEAAGPHPAAHAYDRAGTTGKVRAACEVRTTGKVTTACEVRTTGKVTAAEMASSPTATAVGLGIRQRRSGERDPEETRADRCEKTTSCNSAFHDSCLRR